jgi:hypothetical protein
MLVNTSGAVRRTTFEAPRLPAIALPKTAQAGRICGPVSEADQRARAALAALRSHAQNMRWRPVYKLKQYKGLNKIYRLAANPLHPVK